MISRSFIEKINSALRITKARSSALESRKKIVLAISILFSFGFLTLILTNPQEDDYIDYAYENLSMELKKSCGFFDNTVDLKHLLSISLEGPCLALIATSGAITRGGSELAIARMTEPPSDFHLFTLYTTRVPGREFKTIGILGQFVTVKN